MTDDDLRREYAAARKVAHECPVYTGNETYHAVRSGQRSAAASARYLELMREMQNRGLLS